MKKRYLLSAILSLFLIILVIILWQTNQTKTTDTSLSDIKRNGTLKVGSDLDFGNLEYHDLNNNIIGLNIDIAKKIAEKLEVNLSFKNYSHEELFAKLRSGEIDLAISEIPEIPAVDNDLSFSTPYYSTGQIVITRIDNQNINTIKDLLDKKIGVLKNSNAYSEAKKYSKTLTVYDKIEAAASETGAISDLEKKITDLIIIDYNQAIILVRNDPLLKIVGTPLASGSYGIASKKNNQLLILKINQILKNMEDDGTIDKIKESWPLI